MNLGDRLIAEYKPKIIPKSKNIMELQKWLECNVAVERMSVTDFTPAFINHLYYNVVHSHRNEELQLSEEDFDFIAYRLCPVESNAEYAKALKATHEKYIYVVFETKTDFILSNSSKLFLELMIQCGVSQYDYDNNTLRLLEYVSCLNRYEKKEY